MNEDSEPRIVLCSDNRESYGFTSRDTAVKIDVIGRGWVVQWANRPDSASELVDRIKEWFRSGEIATVHSALSLARRALDEFKSESPLYERNCCQLLVTGFVENTPVIILIEGDAKGELRISRPLHFAAIGSGANIATVFLTCREHNATDRLEDTTYKIYEAKRFSEKAEGVGPLTTLWWHGPGEAESQDSARLGNVSLRGIAALEVFFRTQGFNQKIHVEPFPPGFITAKEPPDPQPPTADPSPPQPSPESREESGES